MNEIVTFNPLVWISEQFNQRKLNIIQIEDTIPNQINEAKKSGHYILALDSNQNNIIKLKEENINTSLFLNSLSLDSLETNIKFDAVLINDIDFSAENILKILRSIILLLKSSGIICFSLNASSNNLNPIISVFEKRKIFNFDSYYDKERNVVYLLFKK